MSLRAWKNAVCRVTYQVFSMYHILCQVLVKYRLLSFNSDLAQWIELVAKMSVPRNFGQSGWSSRYRWFQLSPCPGLLLPFFFFNPLFQFCPCLYKNNSLGTFFCLWLSSFSKREDAFQIPKGQNSPLSGTAGLTGPGFLLKCLPVML